MEKLLLPMPFPDQEHPNLVKAQRAGEEERLEGQHLSGTSPEKLSSRGNFSQISTAGNECLPMAYETCACLF